MLVVINDLASLVWHHQISVSEEHAPQKCCYLRTVLKNVKLPITNRT